MSRTAESLFVNAGFAILVAARSGWSAVFGASKLSAGSADFVLQGYWAPRILWLNVISDALITLSYYAIAVILIYFILKNRDLPFNRISWMFGTFILACGTTHLMEIWNVWHGNYGLAGLIKGLTAAVSLLTAGMLIPLVPKIISVPVRMRLERTNRQLEQQIAERKRAERIRERLAAVVDSSADAIISKTLEGVVTSWNRGAEGLFGYSSSEAVGKSMQMLFPLERVKEESDILERIGRGENAEHFETVRVRKDGSCIDVSATISPIRDHSGIIVGVSNIARDITGRKQAQKRLAEQAKELAASQKALEERVIQRTAQLEAANQELEAFTYSVSHDLRAPLRHIGGFSRMLAEDFGPSFAPEARRHLQRIEDGVHRMGLLIDELLNLARLGRHALKHQTVQLKLVIEEVVSLLQPDAEGRAVTWKIAELPPTECDLILTKQVFQNLIANALKFTRPRECPVIEIGHLQEDGESIIFVRDNGVGFNMKYKDKLFGVFQRLHRAEDFEGTGIGLATVQRILRKHGGRIWAHSELNKGTTFFFTLAAAGPTNTKPNNLDEADPNDRTIKHASAGA